MKAIVKKMIKIDVFSGFLGAGKTTLIKKLLDEAYYEKNIVIIENEFGEIGIDGGFLKDTGIQVNEINSGCICCTLVGDFRKELSEVIDADPACGPVQGTGGVLVIDRKSVV